MTLPKAVLRTEKYLRYLAAGEGDIPNPVTRIDKYLYYLCQHRGSGEGGTSNYDDLSNRPKINDFTLTGNVTLEDIGVDVEKYDKAASDVAGLSESLVASNEEAGIQGTPFRFGVDDSGNYGYILPDGEGGADTVHPFRPGGEPYDGEYNITPSTDEQILETKGKTLYQNIEVEKIPYSETSNQSGGQTVTIG